MSKTKQPTCRADMPAAVKAEFKHIISLLDDRAEKVDSIALELLAASLAHWRRAINDIAEQGVTVVSGGTACAHPALAVAEKSQAQALSIVKELGLPMQLRRRLMGS